MEMGTSCPCSREGDQLSDLMTIMDALTDAMSCCVTAETTLTTLKVLRDLSTIYRYVADETVRLCTNEIRTNMSEDGALT